MLLVDHMVKENGVNCVRVFRVIPEMCKSVGSLYHPASSFFDSDYLQAT